MDIYLFEQLVELRALCKKQGIEISGKKQEIIQRLQALEDETGLYLMQGLFSI